MQGQSKQGKDSSQQEPAGSFCYSETLSWLDSVPGQVALKKGKKLRLLTCPSAAVGYEYVG